MDLQGKCVLVTGAGKGIGRGMAVRLAQHGADVAVADIDLGLAEETAALVRAQGRRAVAVRADVTKLADCEAMVAATVDTLGGLDIAVNNAGVISLATVADLTEAAWDRVMDINVKGVFLSCKAELPALHARGGGAIVNISSTAGLNGFPGGSHYSASKFAVIGFTNSLAKEVARDGITVNAICPGILATDMWHGDGGLTRALNSEGESLEETWQRTLAAMVPQGVAQTPEDLADLVVYFANAPHVTGRAWAVDGGLSAP